MAHFKITTSAKGELQAKIQVSSKNIETGKRKLFTKRLYNKDNLTPAKFRKFVEREAIEFEDKVTSEYQDSANYSSKIYLSLSWQKNGNNL